MEEKYELFTLEPSGYIQVSLVTDDIVTSCSCEKTELKSGERIDSNGDTVVRAIALKGDEFYHDCYLPSFELEKAHKGWEGTLSDLNHMGTTHLMGLGATSDIRFFVGYQDNVVYNPENKTVAMDMHIDEQTYYGKTWKTYVNLCKKAGKTPNVSVSFFAKRGIAKAKDIIYNYEERGYKGDESVTYVKDIHPVALSTVLKGACSDDKGCGINNCSVPIKESVIPEKTQEEIQKEKNYEISKQKLIDDLKKMDKEEQK